MDLERGTLLDDDTLTGAAWCHAHSDLVDAWLAALLEDATEGKLDDIALVAVGGYGRSELCPQSDIDVMLLHGRRSDIRTVSDRVWYPVWDAGLHLGHSVRTLREALTLADDDLETATSLLSARHVHGDERLTSKLADAGAAQWERRSRRWLTQLGARVELRHEQAGEVAFRVEPDLKEGRGGLRDVHALHWAEAAHRALLDHDATELGPAYATLLDVRVELQRHTQRPSNVLVLQEQDAVAAALGLADADALMAAVAQASRSIAWTSDDTWRRIRTSVRGPLGRLARRSRTLGDGMELRDGEVHLAEGADAGDPLVLLGLAAAAAAERAVIARQTLEVVAHNTPFMPDPWPAGARELFVRLLSSGSAAVRVIEALDQRGAWARVLPEWQPVRARPQRNAYHRFTVDRHLLETTANAAKLADRVSRPDLLVVAALLHDLGKGYGGDHSEVGAEMAGNIARRMGYGDEDSETLEVVVRNHLLLAEVATRRDLDEDATIQRVANAVGTLERLELLAALTEADSLATGPSAWSQWKADLVGQLTDAAAHALGGEAAGRPIARGPFPTPEQLTRLAASGTRFETNGQVLTVMTEDRPGVFSRVSGVLALHGLDVLSAAAHSTDDRALAEFLVVDRVRAEIPWPRVLADLEKAFGGRLAIPARLAERARTYGRGRDHVGAGPSVTFDEHASAGATVIDVTAEDGVGVLYRITRALAELDLDIRSAKVQTLGTQVVDSFYVRDAAGAKVTDAATLAEIERAVLHSLSG